MRVEVLGRTSLLVQAGGVRLLTNGGRRKPRVFSPGDKAASFLADNAVWREV